MKDITDPRNSLEDRIKAAERMNKSNTILSQNKLKLIPELQKEKNLVRGNDRIMRRLARKAERKGQFSVAASIHQNRYDAGTVRPGIMKAGEEEQKIGERISKDYQSLEKKSSHSQRMNNNLEFQNQVLQRELGILPPTNDIGSQLGDSDTEEIQIPQPFTDTLGSVSSSFTPTGTKSLLPGGNIFDRIKDSGFQVPPIRESETKLDKKPLPKQGRLRLNPVGRINTAKSSPLRKVELPEN